MSEVHTKPHFEVEGWIPDVLGLGFKQLTMNLKPAEDGAVVATLVKHVPSEDPFAIAGTPTKPRFALLYVHGWNDYYFQRELARHTSAAGGAFYAVDLRRYGRSWREYQSQGFTKDMREYDEDLRESFKRIRAEVGADTPLVMMGHSTGGLTASLWAHRHPKALAGLMLTSPWLEMKSSATFRWAVTPLLAAFNFKDPMAQVAPAGHTIYGKSNSGWTSDMGPLPEELEPWTKDLSVTGWDIEDQWKKYEGSPLLAGFMQAVGKAQTRVHQGLDIKCPVFMWSSTSSAESVDTWKNEFFYQDTVLWAPVLVERAAQLGNNISIRRSRGKHDPLLSFPPERIEFWKYFHRWVAGELLQDWHQYERLGKAGITAICPQAARA